jgi:hypothetical protein
MHTIDLLRGQGIPPKTTLGSATMVVIMVVVPIIAAAGMVDRYLQNKTEIEIKQYEITVENATVGEFADAVKFKESIQRQQDSIYRKLSEVSTCLDNYIQWSPVLETLARYMPPQMVMSSLRAESTGVQQKVTGKNNSERANNVTVYKRKLVLDISGTELRNYNDIVQGYADHLKSSPALGPKLEDVDISQKPGGTGDTNTVSYTMNLRFKPGTL